MPTVPKVSPLAGRPAPKEMLIDVGRLERDFFEKRPDVTNPEQLVSFGTSGHRGSSLHGVFTEAHILAITQAICDYRRAHGPDGPLYLGKDTHALSGPAERTALDVLTANGVDTIVQPNNGITPVPVISRAILAYNRGREAHIADGIAVTPSHNPPKDGGFKYNPAHGGPAGTEVTQWVENRANELLRAANAGVKRVPFASAIRSATTHQEDFVLPYVRDLRNVVDMDAIRAAHLKLAVDPGEHYRELTAQFGAPWYTRLDAPATPEQKTRLRTLTPEAVGAQTLAGDPILSKLTRAPGDDAPIGGLKVVTANGSFAARPSGTGKL
ncbi:MAG TPA: phosphoglucomutase [Bryobacteraceae bacterium]|nr:phosphoglucomutase [Bryobacteraceae bacterium]